MAPVCQIRGCGRYSGPAVVSPLELLLANLAVVLGALIQASTGVGGGFIVIPALAAIDVLLVPGPVILGSLPLSLAMALRGRDVIDTSHFTPIAAGLVPGSVLGAWLLTQIPLENAGVLFGAVVLVGAGLSVAGLVVPINRATSVATGALSGVLGTSGGNGGIVLALLYQHAEGPALRATMGLLYFAASLVMLGMLASFGRFGLPELAMGTWMIPGYLLGFALSPRFTSVIDRGYARPVVLGMCVLSALALMIGSL